MTEWPSSVSNDNCVELAEAANQGPDQTSQLPLRVTASVDLEQVASELPESVLQWLHYGLDRPNKINDEVQRARFQRFETAIVERLFPYPEPRTFLARLREHSLATATTARIIAEYVSLASPDTACAVGWLHDMGVAASLRQAPFARITDEGDAFELAWPAVVRKAPEQSVRLAAAWRLPSGIRYAIREHGCFGSLRPVRRTASASFVAEHLAGCIGFGFRDEQPIAGLRAALATLGLSERDLAPIGRRAERQLVRETRYWLGAWRSAGA